MLAPLGPAILRIRSFHSLNSTRPGHYRKLGFCVRGPGGAPRYIVSALWQRRSSRPDAAGRDAGMLFDNLGLDQNAEGERGPQFGPRWLMVGANLPVNRVE